MSLFMHEYKKSMANIKVKSFFANHLCKKNCLQADLSANQDKCLADCDDWTRKFYDRKREGNPEMAQQVLYQV